MIQHSADHCLEALLPMFALPEKGQCCSSRSHTHPMSGHGTRQSTPVLTPQSMPAGGWLYQQADSLPASEVTFTPGTGMQPSEQQLQVGPCPWVACQLGHLCCPGSVAVSGTLPASAAGALLHHALADVSARHACHDEFKNDLKNQLLLGLPAPQITASSSPTLPQITHTSSTSPSLFLSCAHMHACTLS